MIPGSNLLKSALRVVASQTAQYYAATGRATNEIGYDVTAYAAPVTFRGSIQPVARTLYDHMGLDFSKSYITVYAPLDIKGVDRDFSGDKISYGGKDYQCISTTAWVLVDGWNEILCVAV